MLTYYYPGHGFRYGWALSSLSSCARCRRLMEMVSPRLRVSSIGFSLGCMHVRPPEPPPPSPSTGIHAIRYPSTASSATCTRQDYPWLTEASLPFQRQERRPSSSSPPTRRTTADMDDEK